MLEFKPAFAKLTDLSSAIMEKVGLFLHVVLILGNNEVIKSR